MDQKNNIKGQKELQEAVLNTNLCTGCGACINLCPYFKSYKGRTAVLFPCTLAQGRCFAYCPKVEVDLDYLSEKFFGRPYHGDSLGSYRTIMTSRAGKKIEVVFKPAPPNSGINFIRTDIPDNPIIPATISSLTDLSKRPRRTSIGQGEVEIHTIEHLLATLCGLEIDNITVEINGPELPGLDGSAEGFVRILKKAGVI